MLLYFAGAVQWASAKSFEPQEHFEYITKHTARVGLYQPSATVNATVKPTEAVLLKAELSGRVEWVAANAGTYVDKGETLLRQDTTQERAELAAINAKLAKAMSLLTRTNRLFKQGATSQEALEQASAEHAVLSAEANRLQAVIDKKTIIAPFSGMIGIHDIHAGSMLEEQQAIAWLNSTATEYWIDFQLPEFYPTLTVGQLLELIDIEATATVVGIDPLANEATGLVKHRAKLISERKLTANTQLQLHIPLAEQQQQLVVPATAVQFDSFGAYIFALEPVADGIWYRAQRKAVKISTKESDRIWLKEGLSEGVLIANLGAFKLYPGILVNTDGAAQADG